MAELITTVGIVLVALSAAPIVRSKELGTGAKIALTLLYYLVAAVVVLVLGASLLCLYRCN